MPRVPQGYLLVNFALGVLDIALNISSFIAGTMVLISICEYSRFNTLGYLNISSSSCCFWICFFKSMEITAEPKKSVRSVASNKNVQHYLALQWYGWNIATGNGPLIDYLHVFTNQNGDFLPCWVPTFTTRHPTPKTPLSLPRCCYAHGKSRRCQTRS